MKLRPVEWAGTGLAFGVGIGFTMWARWVGYGVGFVLFWAGAVLLIIGLLFLEIRRRTGRWW